MKKTLIAVGMAAIVASLAILTFCSDSQAADPPYSISVAQPNFFRVDNVSWQNFTFTNGQARTFTANATNTLELTLPQDSGISIFVTTICTNANGTAQLLGWDVSADGTNFTSNRPLKFSVPGNATGTNTYWTNVPATFLNNLRSIQLTLATNVIVVGADNSNTVTIPKIVYSY